MGKVAQLNHSFRFCHVKRFVNEEVDSSGRRLSLHMTMKRQWLFHYYKCVVFFLSIKTMSAVISTLRTRVRRDFVCSY